MSVVYYPNANWPAAKLYSRDEDGAMGVQMQTRSAWFDVYAAAILENDLEKVTQRVASARKAIADRIAQLEAGELAGNREARDLEDALNKLQILVNVSCAMQGTPPYAGAIGYQQASS